MSSTYSRVRGVDGVADQGRLVRIMDAVITECIRNGHTTLDHLKELSTAEEIDPKVTELVLFLRGHLHYADKKVFYLGDVYQSDDGFYFTLEKPVIKEDVMSDFGVRCIACNKNVTVLGVSKMCKECEANPVSIIQSLFDQRESTGFAYLTAFADLSEEDGKRRDAVLVAHRMIKEIVMYRQRHDERQKFISKLERTIAKDDDFGKAIGLWWTHMKISEQYDQVLFHSISLRNDALREWVKKHAER